MSRYCPCGTALARDNTDHLCSVCRETRQRGRAPDVPPDFWQTDTMAAALAGGDLGRVIRAYRCHPFHRQRLSQALIAGWLHMSQAAVCRLEAGRRRVTIDEIVAIARALGMPLALPWALQPEAGEDVNPLSRRSLLGAGAGAAFGLNATTVPAAACKIDPELAAHWVRLLHLLDVHDALRGPHEALVCVRHEIDLIACHRVVVAGDLHRQLLRVESRWAQFAAWLSNDVGDRRQRDAWLERALRLAREGDYPEMVAYVLMRQSHWATEDRDAPRAIALARAAVRTPGATERVRALCALHEAQGHALAGDADLCERSLADADERFDRSQAPPSPWDDLARNAVNASARLAADARCWLWLRPARAIGMFDEAVRAWPPNRVRSRGIQQARLALACVGAGEPERAAAEGLRALGIAQTTKSDGIVSELKRLDHHLASCDVPAAADFREALAAL